MNPLRRLNIRGRLILILLLVGGTSALVTAYQGYRSGENNLTARITAQLTSLTEVTTHQLEGYLALARGHVRSLGSDRMIADALIAFARADVAEPGDAPAPVSDELRAFYEAVFLARLALISDADPVADYYLPDSDWDRYLQNLYLRRPAEDKQAQQPPVPVADASAYGAVHRDFHPALQQIKESMDYKDIFLVGPDGRVLYTVIKEVDFRTDLVEGPFNDSGLARSFRASRRDRGTRSVHAEDFSFYGPSYGEPAAFLSTPVFDGDTFAGVLVVQISPDRINDIVNLGQRWSSAGLGQTGEMLLVGSDKLARSAVRGFVEDREAYYRDVRENGVDAQALELMQVYDTPILLQPAASASVEAAIRGERSIRRIERDYRGRAALSASAPVEAVGLDWVLLAVMPLDEAFEPVRAFERRIVVTVALLSIVITLLAMALTRLFTRPIKRIIARSQSVVDGNLDTDMRLDSHDEYAELSHVLQSLVDSLRRRTRRAAEESRRVQSLLKRFLPEGVARKLSSRGDSDEEFDIFEPVPNATFVHASLTGYDEFMQSREAEAAVQALDDLVERIDTAAERHGVEKVRTVGATYFAVSGLSTPHLDHDRRAIRFAAELVDVVKRFRGETGAAIGVRVGAATGSAMSGIIGRRRLAFDVWGDPVAESERLGADATPGEVRVSAELASRLSDELSFEQPDHGPGRVLAERDTAD